MWYKFPLKIPKGTRLTITQRFGKSTLPVEPEGPNGEENFHYGLDVVRENNIKTFGTPIVCPFPGAKLIGYAFDTPMSKSTNFIKLEYKSPAGFTYRMVAAHISEIVFRSSYEEGDVIAYVGNAGMVQPKPTPATPWNGAHLHLGLQVNGRWVDPLDIFDIEEPYEGESDDVNKDIPAIRWAVDELTKLLAALQAKMNTH